jgi:glyoxylase-like metal-dependent hydrolase (beta-lactamase superfamily II)
MFEGDKASLKPYIAAGRFVPFDGGPELVPGIRAIPAPGHTPGHTLLHGGKPSPEVSALG